MPARLKMATVALLAIGGLATAVEARPASRSGNAITVRTVSGPAATVRPQSLAPVSSTARKAWLTSNFRLRLGHLPAKRVSNAAIVKFDGVDGESKHRDHKGQIEVAHGSRPSPATPPGAPIPYPLVMRR